MLVNGKALVRHALEHAKLVWNAEELILVAAPSNVDHLIDVTWDPWQENADVDIVIQPRPTSILDAIKRGARMAHHERLLILCADNTFDGNIFVDERLRSANVIATRVVFSEDEANRFTRLITDPNDKNDVKTWIAVRGNETRSRRVWIGPLLLDTVKVMQAFEVHAPATIEALINQCSHERGLEVMTMSCEDFGVPEMVL